MPKGPNCNGHGHGAAPLVRPVIGLRGHRRGRLRLHGAAPTFEATLPGRGGVWMAYGWLGRMPQVSPVLSQCVANWDPDEICKHIDIGEHGKYMEHMKNTDGTLV